MIILDVIYSYLIPSILQIQNIIDGLLIDVSNLKKVAADSTDASSTIVSNLTKAEQTIARQQLIIEEQSDSFSFLKKQLATANATVNNLEGVNEALESDVAYLVDQQKYSSLVANRLEKANGTILRLQTVIQGLKGRSTRNKIDRQNDDITSTKQLSSSSSYSLSQDTVANTEALFTSPVNRKRSIGEITDQDSKLQLHIPERIIKVSNAPQQSSSAPPSLLSSFSLPNHSSTPSSDGIKNMKNNGNHSNKGLSITDISTDKQSKVETAKIQLRPPLVVTPVADETLIGRQIKNTFQGFGRRFFHGKIMSYDNNENTYRVKYDDGYEQNYPRVVINSYLVEIPRTKKTD
jgi:hypothetical protein